MSAAPPDPDKAPAPTRRLQVLDEGNDGTFLRVAFATADRRRVDQHFGAARSFVIYGVNPVRAQLLSVTEFGDLSQDGNEAKLADKMALLEGCVAVYCRACGASAVRQLMELGVQPVKVSEDTAIEELLAALQGELRDGPSSWLAKAIARQRLARDGDRFDAMAAEGWQE